jgi:hypothetical protein
MSRAVPVICRQVLLGRSRALSSARDIAQWFATQVSVPDMTRIGGMVMLDNERWLCFIEGPAESVEQLVKQIESQLKPRFLHILMTDRRARGRLFGQLDLGWRHDCTPLEMVAFIADIKRHGTKSQEWHLSMDECVNLLDKTSP